jgi:hypothetical protein
MQFGVELRMNCDICGKTCIRDPESGAGSTEHARLDASWGYFSDKDTIEQHCVMCESCFDRVWYFIEHDLGGKVHTSMYAPHTNEYGSLVVAHVRQERDDRVNRGVVDVVIDPIQLTEAQRLAHLNMLSYDYGE